MANQLRQMPRRFLDGAPDIVRRGVIDIVQPKDAAPLDYDVILRDDDLTCGHGQCIGLDFGKSGAQGCHFFLSRGDMRDYRSLMRRRRVAWRDLPEPTQRAIVRYLEE